MSDPGQAGRVLDQVTAEYSQAMAAHLGYQLKKSDPEMFNLALMRMEHRKHVLDLERREKALMTMIVMLSLPALIVSVICVVVAIVMLHEVPARDEYRLELRSMVAAAVQEAVGRNDVSTQAQD